MKNSYYKSTTTIFLITSSMFFYIKDLIAEPTLQITLNRDNAYVDDVINLEVLVKWNGSFDSYIVYPPNIEFPDGVKTKSIKQFFETSSNNTTYHFQYEVVATNSGVFDLKDVSVDYRENTNEKDSNRAESRNQPVNSDKSAPYLVGKVPRITVLDGNSLINKSSISAFIVFVVSLIVIFALRKLYLFNLTKKYKKAKTEKTLVDFHILWNLFNSQEYEKLLLLIKSLKYSSDIEAQYYPSDEKIEGWINIALYAQKKGLKEEMENLIKKLEKASNFDKSK